MAISFYNSKKKFQQSLILSIDSNLFYKKSKNNTNN